MGWIRRLARSTVDVDRPTVALTNSVRAGFVIMGVLFGALALDRLSYVIAGVIGILFAGVIDPESAEGNRAWVMAWGAVWGALVALVAGLVSSSLVAVLVATVPVVFCCGFAGAFGGRSGVVGMLGGVVFAIFAGTPTSMTASVRDAVAYLLGGLLLTVVVAVPGRLRRARSPRAALGRFLRGLALVHPDDAGSLVADDDTAAVTDWLVEIGDRADAGRLAMLALAIGEEGDPPELRAGVERLVVAGAAVARAGARDVVWPLHRRALVRARANLLAVADDLLGRSDLPPRVAGPVTQVRDDLVAVADALAGPWPIGRVGRGGGARHRVPWRRRVGPEWRAVRGHLRMDDPFLRHALRLTVTFAAAVALSWWLDLPHPYWLPMTVAWISKPAQSDTTTKVIARVLGTVVGVVVSAAVLEVVGPGDRVLAVLVGLSAVLALTFLVANYALAVTGVTMFVFYLFTMAGEPMGSSFASRILATVLAGVLVFVTAVVWPTRTGGGVVESMATLSDALATYARAVLAGGAEDLSDLHGVVVDARTAATADLWAIGFEVGHHRLHPESGAAVLGSLHEASALCRSRELAGATDPDREAVAPVQVEFTDLATRLRSIDDSGAVPVRAHPPAPGHPVHGALRRAHLALDGATTTRHHGHHVHDRLA